MGSLSKRESTAMINIGPVDDVSSTKRYNFKSLAVSPKATAGGVNHTRTQSGVG